MDSTRSISNLPKANFTQLLTRTFEQLEDPKYATVPQTHWNELRPSILSKYHIADSQSHGCKATNLSRDNENWGNACKGGLSKTALPAESPTQKSTSRCSPKPSSIRTLNRKMQPIWRFCASAMHLKTDNDTREKPATVEAQQSSHKSVDKTDKPITTGKKRLCCRFHEEAAHKSKWRSQSFDHLQKSQPNLDINAAFEVLPQFFENRTHSLLYQNSYLLDGVKYDYATTNSQQQSAKLYLNYMKFLKSLKKPAKPTDCEIVFGKARIVTNPSPHWEGARIDWLLNLERKQELRKLQNLEQQKKLIEKQKCIELARTEAKIKQKSLKNANAKSKKQMQKPEPAVKFCDDCQSEKRKFFFSKRFQKSTDCKKRPKIELLPTL